MSEEPLARKRHCSEDSSAEELSKKTKLHASGSGLQCDNQLQLRIDEGIRQLSARRSDLQRGCVASKERILALLDAMRAEILGGAASDKVRLREPSLASSGEVRGRHQYLCKVGGWLRGHTVMRSVNEF